MAQSMYDSDMGLWGQNVMPQHAPGNIPPIKPKHQDVGCFTYLGFLIGAFGILAGSYMLFMVVADMPGRGKMPPTMEWCMIFMYLLLIGMLPLVLSIRSVLRVRRINKTNEDNYRRALAEYGQANPQYASDG